MCSPSCELNSVGPAQSLFLLLLQSLSNNQCSLASTSHWPQDEFSSDDNGNRNFDFIVVGAGSAGSIVASRLSENPNWEVLLIEAGGDPPMESNIPALFPTIWNTDHDWAYSFEPSPNYGTSLAAGTALPRGKMLGGCGSLNGMIYLRGFPYDFDEWAALGNTGWDYDSCKKFFRRIEGNMASNATNILGKNGPLKIDYPYRGDETRNVIASAVQEVGYPWAIDFNGDDRVGYSNTQATIYKGIRQSSALAYLVPAAAEQRPNLHVYKNCQVTELLMNANGDRVKGVKFTRENRAKTFKARASKEVILSAGVVNTPQILMHSGIGPEDHLTSLGISTIKNLPVGRNLQDHFFVNMFGIFPENPFDKPTTFGQTLDTIYDYLKVNEGPLSGSGIDFIGFLNTKDGPEAETANVEILHVVNGPQSPNLEPLLRSQRYQESHIQELLEVNHNATIVNFMNSVAKPESRGWIELASADKKEYPKIYPNYLDEESDVEVLAESLKFHYDLLQTSAFTNAGVSFHFFSDIECTGPKDIEYFKCYARLYTNTVCHPVGTAKMGPSSDPTSVVDRKLRVHGIKRLRVCDASVMPTITTTNPNAAVQMIGERCAQFIKTKYAV